MVRSAIPLNVSPYKHFRRQESSASAGLQNRLAFGSQRADKLSLFGSFPFPMQRASDRSVEIITRLQPRRLGGAARRGMRSEEQMHEEHREQNGKCSRCRSRNLLSWRDAVDTVLGTSPQKIWRTLNWCLPALLLTSTLFTYLAWRDELVRQMFLGFIALTVVFWALLNW